MLKDFITGIDIHNDITNLNNRAAARVRVALVFKNKLSVPLDKYNTSVSQSC